MPDQVLVFYTGIAALAIAIFGRIWLKNWLARTCQVCYRQPEYCECHLHCKHPETTDPRWSQDGWVARCRRCSEIVYLGDDHDGGPKR
jgi:hypothetical protein